MAAPSRPLGFTGRVALVQLVLNWQAVTGAATYNLYKNDTVAPLQTGITGTTVTILADRHETASYKITAVNSGAEESAPSDAIRVVNGQDPAAPPTIP